MAIRVTGTNLRVGGSAMTFEELDALVSEAAKKALDDYEKQPLSELELKQEQKEDD